MGQKEENRHRSRDNGKVLRNHWVQKYIKRSDKNKEPHSHPKSTDTPREYRPYHSTWNGGTNSFCLVIKDEKDLWGLWISNYIRLPFYVWILFFFVCAFITFSLLLPWGFYIPIFIHMWLSCWSLKKECFLTILYFYSPSSMFTVFDIIFYTFLFMYSLTIYCVCRLFYYFVFNFPTRLVNAWSTNFTVYLSLSIFFLL